MRNFVKFESETLLNKGVADGRSLFSNIKSDGTQLLSEQSTPAEVTV